MYMYCLARPLSRPIISVRRDGPPDPMDIIIIVHWLSQHERIVGTRCAERPGVVSARATVHDAGRPGLWEKSHNNALLRCPAGTRIGSHHHNCFPAIDYCHHRPDRDQTCLSCPLSPPKWIHPIGQSGATLFEVHDTYRHCTRIVSYFGCAQVGP